MATREIEDYEQFLASIPYVYNFEFDHEIENKSFLPPFVDTFKPRMFPNQFIEEFFYINRMDESLIYYIAEGKREAIEGKINRAYASLVREHHLYLLLKDKYKTVIRNNIVDYYWGIDVLVIRGPFAYAVHAYTSTKRSKGFHEHKVTMRHKDFNCGIKIDLPLTLATAPKVGEIFVYGPKDIDIIEGVIRDTEEEFSQVAIGHSVPCGTGS